MSTKTTNTNAKIAIPAHDAKAEPAVPTAPKELKKLQQPEPNTPKVRTHKFAFRSGFCCGRRIGRWTNNLFVLALVVYFVAHQCTQFTEDYPELYKLFSGVLEVFEAVVGFLLNLLSRAIEWIAGLFN